MSDTVFDVAISQLGDKIVGLSLLQAKSLSDYKQSFGLSILYWTIRTPPMILSNYVLKANEFQNCSLKPKM